jgi:pSer/pThr/pTyr-binding forkhead associated (FHA) protein
VTTTPLEQVQAGLSRVVAAPETVTFDGSLDTRGRAAMNTSNDMPACMVSAAEAREIVVGSMPVVIGRDPGCDVRLDSPRVSRYHCCVTGAGGEVVVRDLGSTNGLRINGRRVSAGRLRPGDTLAVAQVEFRVEPDVGAGVRLRQSSDQESDE